MIILSIPIIQVYSTVATPDTPMMFFTVMFLWCYKHFLKKKGIIWTILLGLSIALLGYSKYTGVVVVLSVLISNFSLLKQWRSYAAVLIAMLFLFPHFLWQYNNDFVSFKYHLVERNEGFYPFLILEYIGNILLIYNPFIVFLFYRGLKLFKPVDLVERSIVFISISFILFFGISTFRGHVQPQWIFPSVLGMVTWSLLVVRSKEKLRKISFWICPMFIVMLFVGRIIVVFFTFDFGFGGNNDMLRLQKRVGNIPVAFNSSYSKASLYTFYTGGDANSYNRIFSRSNQYQLWSIDKNWYNKRVAVETYKEDAIDSLSFDNGKWFYYKIIDNYIPVHNLKIELVSVSDNCNNMIDCLQMFKLNLRITNPYPFEFKFGNSQDLKIEVWLSGDGSLDNHVLTNEEFVIRANECKESTFLMSIPDFDRKYKILFAVDYNGIKHRISAPMYYFSGKERSFF